MAVNIRRPLTGPSGWLRASLICIALASLQLQAKLSWAEKFEEYENIDAFNPDICGGANFRDWQLKQSAFGCISRRYREMMTMQGTSRRGSWRQSAGRRSDGIAARAGELPFFVRLDVINEKTSDFEPLQCGGTLIHNDLVLTSASCIAGAKRIQAWLGSNKRWTLTDTRGVDRYCMAKGFDLSKPAYNDLAVLRLWHAIGPLFYERNRMSPACLAPLDRASESTLCMMTGMGREVNPFLPLLDSETLMTLPVQRNCEDKSIKGHTACYQTTGKSDVGCPYQPGSPLVCYDKCKTYTHRAYVMGVISKYSQESCGLGKRTPLLATDINWQLKNLRELLYAIRQSEKEEPRKGLKCRDIE